MSRFIAFSSDTWELKTKEHPRNTHSSHAQDDGKVKTRPGKTQEHRRRVGTGNPLGRMNCRGVEFHGKKQHEETITINAIANEPSLQADPHASSTPQNCLLIMPSLQQD
mmetsp:Transcript_4791/g.30376  ORF Transcript_4791/g.30376 Transcript_4791/m.30376 type:complete len:109 (-) Transcript_4791:1780-2106(-)